MYAKRQSKTLSVIPTNANEKGIVLVGTIALVAILAVFGTLGIVTTSTELIISKNYKSSVQARYVAEAGIHRTIGMINSSPGWLDGINPAINAFLGDNFFGNGTYEVNVYENEPTTGKIRILTTGEVNGSSSTFEAVVSPQTYKILDYATFDCGTITLKVSPGNIIKGDVFINGNLDLEDSGIQEIQGNVQATGDIVIGGTSRIIGNAYANGNIDLESTWDPNIQGDAEAGGVVSGTGTVSGIVCFPPDDCSNLPVVNLCDPDNLAPITITSDDIQKLRVKADYTYGNYEFMTADNLAGIVHVTGDFELTVDSTFSEDLVIIVDGSKAEISANLTTTNDASVIFLVPNGSFKVLGGADVIINGTIIVGTVDSNGDPILDDNGDPIVGAVKVTEDSNLTVYGRVIVVNGNTDAESGGTFVVEYPSSDDNDLISSGTYAMLQWREIRN